MNKDTKEYIIAEAYKLFLNHSYEAASISTISDAIGLTKGALYHHFKNKEELFKAVIDKYFTISPIIVDVDTITFKEYNEVCINFTSKILHSIFHQDVDFVPVNYLALIAESFRHHKGFSEEKMKFIESETSKVKTILDNAIKRGEIRSDINTSIVSRQYLSLSIGIAIDILHNSSLDSAIGGLKEQLNHMYLLLKI